MRVWAGCWLAFALAAAGAGAAEAQTLRRAEDGAAASGSVEDALRAGSLLVALAPGESLTAFGFTFEAKAQTSAHVSASSEYVTFAVLSGQVRSGRARARAGRAIVGGLASGQARSYAFDLARLVGTAPPAVAEEIAQAAAPAMRRRRWLDFIGYYEPVGVNTAAPSAAALEPVRRTLLLEPEVLALRRNTPPEEQRGAVAARFTDRLAARDAAAVASLIDPAPFISVGRDWAEARAAFAQELVSADGVGALEGERTVTEEGDAMVVASSSARLRLGLIEREGFTFVESVEVLP